MRLCAVLSLSLTACALSHELPADASMPVDAPVVRLDATPPPRDLGPDIPPRPDLGVLVPCHELADCRAYPGTICRRDPTAPPDDLAAVPLVCAPPNGGAAGVAGALCDDTDDLSCAAGLCVVGGTCVEPCVPDPTSDPIIDRCDEVWVRTSPTSMQHVVARTLRVLAVDGLRIDDLGPVTVPGGGTATASFSFTTEGTTDVIVFDGPEGESFVTRLVAGSGTLLYDAFDVGPTMPAPVGPVSTAQSIPTIELPCSPTEPRDPANRYSATLVSADGATMHAIGLSRTDARATLDLDFFYAGATGYAGHTVPLELDSAIALMRGTYGAAGIAIGEVRVHELVGGLRSRWAVLPDPTTTMDIRLDDLFTLSAGVPSVSVCYFLVRSAGMVLGLAGGIPGPSPVTGSPGSGIVLAVDMIGSTPEVPLSSVLAHETGHYLGLFHTSEYDGSVVEPLADTPECRPAQDLNGDGFLTADECAGHGGENIMFWGTIGTPMGFTPDQVSVITRSMTLR